MGFGDFFYHQLWKRIIYYKSPDVYIIKGLQIMSLFGVHSLPIFYKLFFSGKKTLEQHVLKYKNVLNCFFFPPKLVR
jgi:hypothetical protein